MTSEQKFNCIFCKDVFDNKEELQVHFRKHADPKFKSKNRFDSEPIQSEENPKEKAEMVRCDVCPLMFPTISKAITHKHKVHPDHDIKYFCPWCGKLFTMKHPYTIHIKTTHGTQTQEDDKTFHCDCCNVDFFVASAMLYHNKFFHRQDSDIIDIGSSKKLRLYNQEIIQLYYCAFCGDEYENKVNLIKHTTDDHSDEDQSPEDILRCPLCDAIFYHLDAYEIHLSFHSTDDLYSANNEMFANLLDFSLETVPPVMEKVDNTDDMEPDFNVQEADADSTANALEIEKFLELAMGQTDGDGNPVKVKKKKHKKSKKSAAITLDEFLSMNKDVFGEGLDFQGVEEVPTRVVKKQLKNKKAANAAATAELEKLKEKGIVVMKVGATKPTKNVNKKIVNKQVPNREITTSSEVLSKLINQSNNQIKIVKRSVINKIDTEQQNSTAEEPNEDEKGPNNQQESKQDEKDISENKPEGTPNIQDNNTPGNENTTERHLPTSTVKVTNSPVNKDMNASHDENDTDEKMAEELNHTSNSNNAEPITEVPVANLSPKQIEGKNEESSFDDQNDAIFDGQLDSEENDSEIGLKHTAKDNINIEDNNKPIDEAVSLNEKNNAQSSLRPTDSLSTLKHLSHLTVKPVNQSKNVTAETTLDKITETKKETNACIKKDKEPNCETSASDSESAVKPKVIVDKDPTLDALKMLSKNITIKSLATPTKRNIEATLSESAKDTESVLQTTSNNTNVVTNKNITIKKIKIEKDEPTIDNNDASSNKKYTIKKVENSERYIGSKVINTINNTVKSTPKVVNKINTLAIDGKSNKTDVDNSHNNVMKANNTNILRNLPNITTKPLIVKNTNLQQDIKQTKIPQKESEVIEISDIDDSDEDNGSQAEPKQDCAKPTDALKNLSKHITVKQLNQPATPLKISVKVEKIEEPEYEEDQHDGLDSDDDHTPVNIKVCGQKLSSKNMAFKNALKNLSKNITVKSGTSSPSQLVQTQDHNSQDFPMDDVNEPAGDSDSDVGKVKITEIEDANHDENIEEMDEYEPGEDDDGPIVESPHDSCSDQEAVDETDFESEIKATTLQKTSQEITSNKNNICLNNLKNINKNITIKSVNSNPIDSQTKPKQTLVRENLEETKNQTKQMVIKPPQQTIRESINENTCNNKNFRKVGKIVDQSSNESLNQKVSVNKEVTVKTFQSKTIIQEITTTVTKTIKTVNQTVNKQEARCSSQRNFPILPQKVVGMRPQINSKNLQGVVIRHAAPATVKPNNPGTQLRPTGTVVRASKQIVPMRPGLTVTNTRPKTPRMQAPKTNLPKSSPNKQVIGTPLKFSPTVLQSGTIKRPNTEEVNGPFSCFKKPKESLIPVSDLPSYEGGDDCAVQMNAASHTSTSNYTSTSKIVKGNSVVTATQTKSEMTSMQQYSRIGNAVATKIKNTQFKQTQVQEKSESSAMQRTTLAAIEKLQKQGLLIKKPRIEANETSDDDHIDDNVGYSSADEHEA